MLFKKIILSKKRNNRKIIFCIKKHIYYPYFKYVFLFNKNKLSERFFGEVL